MRLHLFVYSTVLALTAATVIPERAAAEEDLLSLSRLELYKRHVACNARAEAGVMNPGDVRRCSDNFLALKLKFLHGASIERYYGLSPATQRDAHDKGYTAYRAWVHSLRDNESVLRAIAPIEETAAER